MATKAPRIQREHIIQTALDLLDQEGLEGLTLRKLAQALNIQAPSLYWHFNAKQALIDGMADALVENVARHSPSNQAWDEQVRHLGLEFQFAIDDRQ